MYNEYRKSAYLPSLEVKVHAPDLFQPKVQAVIQELEEKRELKEKRLLKQLETAYNQELLSSSQEISNVIKESLSIFDNDNLLQKSIEFAITPPIVLLSETAQEKIMRNNKRKKKLMKTPFVAEHQLNKIAETVPLPIETLWSLWYDNISAIVLHWYTLVNDIGGNNEGSILPYWFSFIGNPA